ncbi:ATS1, partial [Symbiodinium sp. CCMP2456]
MGEQLLPADDQVAPRLCRGPGPSGVHSSNHCEGGQCSDACKPPDRGRSAGAIPTTRARRLRRSGRKVHLCRWAQGDNRSAGDPFQQGPVFAVNLLEEVLGPGNRRGARSEGHIFWVAPSGGRDRRRPETDRFGPAKFDQASVGLFLLLAQKAGRGGGPKTHFFPLAMWTHRLVPPPEDAKAGVGEARSAARAPVGLAFGEAMDAEQLGGRKKFPPAVEKRVNELYVTWRDAQS